MAPQSPSEDALEAALNVERSTVSSLVSLAVLAALFVGAAWFAPERPFFQSGTPVLWMSALLAAVLLAASYVDIKRFILPDMLTLPLIPAGLVFHALVTSLWLDALIGAALGGTTFMLVHIGARRFLQRDGLGLGDVKLIIGGGALCTAWAIPTILMIAAASALFLILIYWRGRSEIQLNAVPIPFGPFIALGIWVAWCYPNLYLI